MLRVLQADDHADLAARLRFVDVGDRIDPLYGLAVMRQEAVPLRHVLEDGHVSVRAAHADGLMERMNPGVAEMLEIGGRERADENVRVHQHVRLQPVRINTFPSDCFV